MSVEVVQGNNAPVRSRHVFTSLEYGRFFAALAVCAFHASGTVARFHGRHPFADFVRAGHAGVEFFFILSGFLVYLIHSDESGSLEAARRFLAKRFIRIMPLLWIATTVLIVLHCFVPSSSRMRYLSPEIIVGNYTLLTQDSNLFLGVAWTLKRELIFYSFLALGLLDRRVGFLAFWLWQVGIISVNLYDQSWSAGARGHTFFGVYNLGFGMGAVVAITLTRWTGRTNAYIASALGGAGLVWLAVQEWLIGGGTPHFEVPMGDLASPLLYLISFTLLIAGFVRLDRINGAHLPAAFDLLGGSSYALYLYHGIVISCVVRIIEPAWGIPVEFVFVICVAAAVSSSLCIHVWFERPLLAWLRLRFAKAPARRDTAADYSSTAPGRGTAGRQNR